MSEIGNPLSYRNERKPDTVTEGGSVRVPDQDEIFLIGNSGLTLEELEDQLDKVDEFLRTYEYRGAKFNAYQLLKELKINGRLMENFTRQLAGKMGIKFEYMGSYPSQGYPNLERVLRILAAKKKTQITKMVK